MIVAIVLATLLRLYMFIVPKSLWGDEYYSIWYTQNLDKVMTLNHPPLYYWVIGLLPGETAMRMLSIVCGVAIVAITYLLAKHLFDRKAGVVASLLVAISPYFLQSSFEIRSYSMLGMLSALALLLFIRCHWVSLGVICVIIPWAEHVGLLLVFGLTLLCFRRLWFVHLTLLPYYCLLAIQLLNDENPSDPSKWIYLTEPLLYVKKLVGLLVNTNVGYRYSMMTVEQLPFREWWFYVLILASCTMLYYAVRGFLRCQHPIKWLIFAPLPLFFYPTKLHARYLVEVMPLYYCLIAGGLCRR